MKLHGQCHQCQHLTSLELSWPLTSRLCPHCKEELLQSPTQQFIEAKKLDQCPLCGASHLFRRKDFNQKLGVALICAGVAGAYFTYGLSLLAVTLVDWLLFQRIGEVGICYQCDSQFRNSPLIESLEPFNLQIFDYYRNLKNK